MKQKEIVKIKQNMVKRYVHNQVRVKAFSVFFQAS